MPRETFLWDRSVFLEGSAIRADFWPVCELLQKHSTVVCCVVSSTVCFRLFKKNITNLAGADVLCFS